MMAAANDERFVELACAIEPGSRLVCSWALVGGVSARVTALEIARPDGQTRRVNVRQHGERDRIANPHIAASEFRLLSVLHAAGLAVPEPLSLDESCALFSTPVVVLEYVEGTSELAPSGVAAAIPQMAAYLARLHTSEHLPSNLSFLPTIESRYTRLLRHRPAQLNESFSEGRIRAALEAVWPLAPRNPSVVLHGDFWPGNILWKNGLIAAVVDWEDAALGDPLADLANTRLELLWAFGEEAMHAFTRHYTALTAFDLTDLPSWDLCAALRPLATIADWGTDLAAMRAGHQRFVAQACAQLNMG